MKLLQGKLTYANVMATIAVFIALGGASYAATQLPKNSVGNRQLKKSSVTAAKIKKGAVSGTKIAAGAIGSEQIARGAVTGAQVKDGSLTGAQVNASTLGTVPSAQKAESLSAPEAWHVVGAPGEPEFLNGWKSDSPEPGSTQSAAFYKDQGGVVHLRGLARGGTSPTIFKLPVGFRPPSERTLYFVTFCTTCVASAGILRIEGTGLGGAEGQVIAPEAPTSLEGVTFRAES